MTVLAHILEPNDRVGAWWPALTAANDDGTCPAPRLAVVCAGTVDVPCETEDGASAPAPGCTMTDGRRHPTRGRGSGCAAYDGDVWADILEYRAMRARSLSGDTLADDELARIAALETRLRGGADERRRQYLRFSCRFRATLEVGELRERIEIHDVSAGGVKIAGECPVREGEAVVLELDDDGIVGSVVLPARVIWARAGAFGLMFAGAPRCR